MQLQYKNLFINPLQCYTNRDRQTCVRIGHPVAACFPVKMPLLDMHHNEKPAVFPTQMINIEFDIKQRKTVFFISNFSYLFLSQDYFLFSSVFNSFLMFFFLFISSPPDGIIQSWLSMISLSFFFFIFYLVKPAIDFVRFHIRQPSINFWIKANCKPKVLFFLFYNNHKQESKLFTYYNLHNSMRSLFPKVWLQKSKYELRRHVVFPNSKYI